MSGRMRITLVVVMISVVTSFATPSHAQEKLKTFWNSCVRDFKRRNCWPEPFEPWDRYAMREALAADIDRGWEVQNMIADFHFKEGTSQLTEAGRTKIKHILTEEPTQRRIIYVRKSENPQENDAHMEAVRQVAAQFLPPGVTDIPVRETTTQLPIWSANRVDLFARRSNTGLLRLPFLTGSGGGGSSMGGSSMGGSSMGGSSSSAGGF